MRHPESDALAFSPYLSQTTTDSMTDQTTTQDTRQLPSTVAALLAFRCEAYSDKGKCQHNRCVQQMRGGYLSRDACDAQLMSYSLGGIPVSYCCLLGRDGPGGQADQSRGQFP